MNQLDQLQEAALIECLRALDAGDGIEASLARHAGQAALLRPYLELRMRLLAIEPPSPHPAGYQAGRQALLDRLVAPAAPPARARPIAWLLQPLAQSWTRIG